jgi:hypothetical protein
MTYIVECRKKDEKGEIIAKQFRGFDVGLTDKKDAMRIFKREVDSGLWDAVYVDKRYRDGKLIDVDCWYRDPALA